MHFAWNLQREHIIFFASHILNILFFLELGPGNILCMLTLILSQLCMLIFTKTYILYEWHTPSRSQILCWLCNYRANAKNYIEISLNLVTWGGRNIAHFWKSECKDVNRTNTKHYLLHINQYVMYRGRVPRSSKTNSQLLKSKVILHFSVGFIFRIKSKK